MPLEPFGPKYPDLGSSVAKFRRMKDPTREQRIAHADAIEQAIRVKQRSELQRELPSFAPSCASRTWHAGCYIDKNGRWISDGAIGQAIRQQQRNALLACPEKARKARVPAEWWNLYEQAMKIAGKWTKKHVEAKKIALHLD